MTCKHARYSATCEDCIEIARQLALEGRLYEREHFILPEKRYADEERLIRESYEALDTMQRVSRETLRLNADDLLFLMECRIAR